MSVGVRERWRVYCRVEWFLARYWVALGFPGAAPLFVGGVAFFCEGVGVLWLAYIRRILTCCTVNC